MELHGIQRHKNLRGNLDAAHRGGRAIVAHLVTELEALACQLGGTHDRAALKSHQRQIHDCGALAHARASLTS